MRREADKSYSLSLEDPKLDGDERYVDGLSEGSEWDPIEAAKTAGDIVSRYLSEHVSKFSDHKREPRDDGEASFA
jgi:hypothetical protein